MMSGPSASTTLTVVKPTSLQRLPDSFDSQGKDCAPHGLNCRTYNRHLTYNMVDQFGDRFNGGGEFTIHVAESFSDLTSTCGPIQLVTGGGTGPFVQLTDDFWICSQACPQCNPQGQGCTATATQTITVNGFVVRTNRVTWTCSDATLQ